MIGINIFPTWGIERGLYGVENPKGQGKRNQSFRETERRKHFPVKKTSLPALNQDSARLINSSRRTQNLVGIFLWQNTYLLPEGLSLL